MGAATRGNRLIAAVIARVRKTFSREEDSDLLRARKVTASMVALTVIVTGTTWGVVFLAGGFYATATMNALAVVAMGVNLLAFARHQRHGAHTHLLLTIGWLWTYFTQLSLGGFERSGLIGLWALGLPLLAVAVLNRAQAMVWFALFAGLLLASVFDVGVGLLTPPALTRSFSLWNAFMNVLVLGVVLFVAIENMLLRLDEARRQADHLLLNILPAPIVTQLKFSSDTIADQHSEVTVLFADIVEFTDLAREATPSEVVTLLNTIFCCFDTLAEELKLEKIKTIGDAYMVAGGLPLARADHAEAVMEMAIRMLECVEALPVWKGTKICIRIGVNTGPVVAGVIGRHKFAYDLWGDAVNTASRMESHGVANSIQVTEATVGKVSHLYRFEARSAMEVKGKGEMVPYLYLGRRES